LAEKSIRGWVARSMTRPTFNTQEEERIYQRKPVQISKTEKSDQFAGDNNFDADGLAAKD